MVAGSSRPVARFLGARPDLRTARMKVARRALMESDPWLRELGAQPDEWPDRFMRLGQDSEGLPVRVVELCGEPGDVVVGHPWLLHSLAPNLGERPRFMRVQRIARDA